MRSALAAGSNSSLLRSLCLSQKPLPAHTRPLPMMMLLLLLLLM